MVFVCGGEVDVTSTSNLSARNMLMNKSSSKSNLEFILAESYKDWLAGYKDLSEFETDIAGLSSIVVVILESPGSLAELGLFYAHEHLRTKLFAIVDSEHYQADSFIKHGLLSPLEALESRLVQPYDLPASRPENYKMEDIIQILDELEEFCESLPASEPADIGNQGHILYFIFEIIKLFNATTAAELKDYLSIAGISITDNRLKSCIHILQKFSLVISEKKSSQTFLLPNPNAESRVELKAQKGQKAFDRHAATIKINKFYTMAASKKIRSEQNRIALIRKHTPIKAQENDAA